MTTLWWKISQEERILLVNYQWDNYKKKLPEIDAPKYLPPDNDYDSEVDPELVKEMQKAPHSQRRVD